MNTDVILNGDCLELMKDIPDASVDMILADLPYGTTACRWDSIISLDSLWSQYERICKKNAPVLLTAAQPFTSQLVMSNPKAFKFEWIWEKNIGTGHLSAKFQPMRTHESVLVFCKETPHYYPKMETGKPFSGFSSEHKRTGEIYGHNLSVHSNNVGTRFPKSIIKFDKEFRCIHPTQKPVELFQYLIETFTLPNEIVLDNCSGSGTTAIAAIQSGRKYICMEMDAVNYQKSVERVEEFSKGYNALGSYFE